MATDPSTSINRPWRGAEVAPPGGRRRFRYLLDPVFLAAVALYACNRWLVKPSAFGEVEFFHSYLNDLLCLPFWLPPVLLSYRLLGLRKHDSPPTSSELALHFVVWSVVFEAVGPRLRAWYPTTVGDPWDVLAYGVGALVGGVLWGTFSLTSLYRNAVARWTGRRIQAPSRVVRTAAGLSPR